MMKISPATDLVPANFHPSGVRSVEPVSFGGPTIVILED